ncbi:MAG: sugar phosphate isomerase/epimerase [Planctomycetaceae bacterium]|nr:sugar phosphate isomerase/epimerase [Planctomycetaceae bacterium]
MKLSLSVRIAEEFLSKEHARIPLEELAVLAKQAGYDALCMRASQVGVQSTPEAQREAERIIREQGLSVTMVTGDFDVVYNNDNGPACLRNIGPFLDLARTLEAPLIRVALKTEDDIPFAQQAADQAADVGIQLVHQCHTLSLFETVEAIEQTLKKIDRPNFGLIYEPANLEICGQDYGLETLERLAPWIVNVYLQNQILKPDGDVTLNTWCRGPVSFDLIPIHEPGGIDFPHVFQGLRSIGYDGPVTAHQSGIPNEPPERTAAATAQFLKGLMHAG